MLGFVVLWSVGDAVEQEKPLVARHIQPALTDGLRHFRVVLLHGPRQTRSSLTTIDHLASFLLQDQRIF